MTTPDYTIPVPYPDPSASPAERIRTAYDLWSQCRGTDPSVITALMADNIVQRSVLDDAQPTALGGTKQTREQIAAYFAELTTQWEMLAYHTHQIVDGGDDVVWVGTCQFRNRATGKDVTTEKVDVFKFENGLVVEVLEMFDSLAFVQAIPQPE